MEPAYLFIGSTHYITHVFMLNKDLYSGDIDGNIIKWNFESRRCEIKWKAHDKCILSIQFLKSKNHLVTHGRDGYLKFWLKSDNKFIEINRMESNPYSFCQMALHRSSNNDYEFISFDLNDEDHTIEIVEYPKDIITYNLCVKPSKSHSIKSYGMVMSISILNNKVMFVGYESGYVIMFKEFQYHSAIKVADCIICMAVSENRLLIIGTPDNELIVIEIDSNFISMNERKKILLKNPGISSVVFRQDGKIFATAGWDGLIRVFTSKGLKQLVALKWNVDHCQTDKTNRHLAVAFTAENYLISGSDDKIICFWDVFRNK